MKKIFRSILSVMMIASVILGAFTGCKKDEPAPAQPETTAKAAPETTAQSHTVSTAESETKESEISEKSAADFKSGKLYAPDYLICNPLCEAYIVEWLDDDKIIINIADSETGEIPDKDHYYEIRINKYGEIISAAEHYKDEDESGNEKTIVRDMSETKKIRYDSNHHMIECDEIQYNDETGKNETYFVSTYKYDDSGKRVERKWSFPNDKTNYAVLKYEYENGQVVKITCDCSNDEGDRIYLYKYDFNGKFPVKVMEAVTSENDSAQPDWENFQNYTYSEVSKAQYDFYNNTLKYLLLDSGNDVW